MSPPAAPVVVNGWTLFAHPLFLAQVDALATEVEALRRKDPAGYARRNAAKRLAAIQRLALEVIPADPSRPEYRQGHTLGSAHAHWCRAKFFQQYRLFFRYHAQSRVIVYAWVNDEGSRRAYESQHDAYRTFRKMLERGHPPDDWEALLAECVPSSRRTGSRAHTNPSTPIATMGAWRRSAARNNAVSRRTLQEVPSTGRRRSPRQAVDDELTGCRVWRAGSLRNHRSESGSVRILACRESAVRRRQQTHGCPRHDDPPRRERLPRVVNQSCTRSSGERRAFSQVSSSTLPVAGADSCAGERG